MWRRAEQILSLPEIETPIVHLITSRCIHVIWWQAAYISNRRRRIDAALSVYSCGTGRISLGLPALPRESFVACSVSTDNCPVIGSNLKCWKMPFEKFVRLRNLWLFLVSDQPASLKNDWTPSGFFYLHMAVHRNIISIVKPTRCTNVSNLFYFGMTLYMFRTVFPSIIRSSRLYIQYWTPDDGRKDSSKHVKCHSKIK